MAKKGRMIYLPKQAIDEMEDIKREDNIFSSSEAFRKMVQYAEVGRELQRLKNLDWSRKKVLEEQEKSKRKK